MKQAQDERNGTADQILDVAEQLVQTRGFNAVSYADVAGELGLTNAALHYHYPSKSDLGEAIITRYAIRFVAALVEIDETIAEPRRKLDAYAELYADVLRRHRMCLCGMLAAEYDTLSAGMRDAVTLFFEENEKWLAQVLQRGRDDRTLSFAGSPLDQARTIVSSLEGAILIARSFGDIKRFQSATSHLFRAFRPTG